MTTTNKIVEELQVELLEVTIENQVATVSLNRPPYNPLNWQLFEELGIVIDYLEKTDKYVLLL